MAVFKPCATADYAPASVGRANRAAGPATWRSHCQGRARGRHAAAGRAARCPQSLRYPSRLPSHHPLFAIRPPPLTLPPPLTRIPRQKVSSGSLAMHPRPPIPHPSDHLCCLRAGCRQPYKARCAKTLPADLRMLRTFPCPTLESAIPGPTPPFVRTLPRPAPRQRLQTAAPKPARYPRRARRSPKPFVPTCLRASLRTTTRLRVPA